MSQFLNPDEAIAKHKDNLPHWQQGDVWVFATWRLADSLPQSKLLKWKEERRGWERLHPKPWYRVMEKEYDKRFGQPINSWLDAGYGLCLLAVHQNATIVKDAFLHFNGDRYHLSDFVVMPNHVHVLFRPLGNHQLENLIKTWKQFTARAINKREGQAGSLWQKNYWDRLIRSGEHFDWVRSYIQNNPKNLPPGSYLLWSEGS